MQDVLNLFDWCLTNARVDGAVNATSPNPVTNGEFTKALGRAVHRPTPFPAPAFAIRALLGDMGNDLLLGSARVHSKRLAGEDFEFECPTLDAALAEMLDKTA
jgi:NAD dependent epimerase/dehydratase family enzyme